MELATVATGLKIAGAAKGAAQGAPNMMRQSFRKLRLLGTFEPAWLDLGDESSELTGAQLSDVRDFLADADTTPILALLTLLLMTPTGAERDSALGHLEDTFINLAKRWTLTRGSSWVGLGEALWQRICDVYEGVLPDGFQSADLTAEIEDYTHLIQSPLHLADSAGEYNEFLRELTVVARDIDRLTESFRNARRLAVALHSGLNEPIITHSHAELDYHADFARLYIDRDFKEVGSGQIVSAETLASGLSLYRIVLMGTPGAGKTTFVSHLVRATSDPTSIAPTASMVVKCRDYANLGWRSSITRFMAEALHADTSVKLTEEELCDVLVLGKAICVFDGLDEITDLPKRAEMVKRINMFTARFPALPVLVTTREIGYEQSPLPRKAFTHVRLNEFEEDQVLAYCKKWFDVVDRRELVTPFIDESKSVSDLRTNPLLLSLLCILYRDSGAIPADRRGIYSKCAELLFKKWDAFRQVTQPGSLPKYADRLMQEVARWFYLTPSTQAGLEESQITKVLSQYMVAALGFPGDEAETSARDFMSFCAGRAWLLGPVGTRSGQRLFRFTHRTFYEYFASESLTRLADSPDAICSHIEDAWRRDSTSVAPELLIQAYDYSHERGAAKVYQQLCKRRSTPNALLFRLIDATMLPAYARRDGFNLIIERWSTESRNPNDFLALLRINSQARAQFIAEFLSGPTNAAYDFLNFWSSMRNSSLGGQYEENWLSAVTALTAMIDTAEIAGRFDTAAYSNWALGSGIECKEEGTSSSHLLCSGPFGTAPGAIWWCIESRFTGGDGLPRDNRRSRVIERLHREVLERKSLHSYLAEELYEALMALDQDTLQWQRLEHIDDESLKLRDILAVLLAAFVEVRDAEALDLVEAVGDVWDEPFLALASLRLKRLGLTEKGPTAEDVAAGNATLKELPKAFRQWGLGKLDFVRRDFT